MKKAIFLFLIYFIPASTMFAQETPPTSVAGVEHPIPPTPTLLEKLFFGGDLGLSFGDVTYIYLAPTVGYKLHKDVGVGIGPSYSYLKDARYPNFTYETHTYGGRVFGMYRFFQQGIAYGEYGVVSAEVYNLTQTEIVRRNIPSLLFGGGYIAPIGAYGNFTLMALWNFAESDYSYYENPIIRAGFNIGF